MGVRSGEGVAGLGAGMGANVSSVTRGRGAGGGGVCAVSYTHLTLPTIA